MGCLFCSISDFMLFNVFRTQMSVEHGFCMLVGMARCAVPVAERSVRRRNKSFESRKSPFVPTFTSFRAGTPQRGVPTIEFEFFMSFWVYSWLDFQR